MPPAFTSLQYRPHDAYSVEQLALREQLKARSSAATWKPEQKHAFDAKPNANLGNSWQPEVVMRRGRTVPTLGDASSTVQTDKGPHQMTAR